MWSSTRWASSQGRGTSARQAGWANVGKAVAVAAEVAGVVVSQGTRSLSVPERDSIIQTVVCGPSHAPPAVQAIADIIARHGAGADSIDVTRDVLHAIRDNVDVIGVFFDNPPRGTTDTLSRFLDNAGKVLRKIKRAFNFLGVINEAARSSATSSRIRCATRSPSAP